MVTQPPLSRKGSESGQSVRIQNFRTFAPMISISNLSYYIGDRPLYEDANLHITPKAKIGLVGLNGTGKSTLLRLIDGEYTPDEGIISKSNDTTIGFLNQDLLSYQTNDSILTVAMEAFGNAVELQRQIEKTIHQLEVEYSDKLVEKLTRQQEEFERLGGYSMQSQAEAVLEGIGFRTEDLHRPLKEFSGGWRMRVMLTKLLLQRPSLLMLDEPTNHLDLPSIQWLENYLKTYQGAFIIVSHDQDFLNNTVDMVVEVSQQQLITYVGNYDHYLIEKEERSELQRNAYENQQQQIKQTERFIERFRSKATKARQVQSRVKALDRMDKIEAVAEENRRVNFKFTMSRPSGKSVILLEGISKAYGDLQILNGATAEIRRGDKIALIGANGKGKSTVLRIIAGEQVQEGQRTEGHNVNMAFYAQHQLESLGVDNEILEELKGAGSKKTETELRNLLGCFLFTDEEVFKKIKVLSGGEKSRVALAKTLLSEANFLLLDEPTNHLDLQSVNILIQALEQYEGSYIVVSHNRHFINHIANKIWWIEDGEIREYPGTYKEFVWWQAQQEEKKAAAEPQSKQAAPKQEKPAPAPKKAASPEQEKERKQLQRQLEESEKQVTALEQQEAKLEAELAKPEVFGNPERLLEVNSQYTSTKEKLEAAQQQWEDLMLRLEELE
ncbi:putative ABC transporter ATP-binding protein YheS [Cesiribacter andamanensis AMV16]|uniref:Putative ABC transporter ATP-binding protein YheS n=2 Tax=Cesiribacter TaxID=1133570 RepID=M7NP15_9BACT|nr:putative ABC transporter ATP-binding protein YheS [Cesiribacter andamanensis AMV16]